MGVLIGILLCLVFPRGLRIERILILNADKVEMPEMVRDFALWSREIGVGSFTTGAS